MEVGYRLVGLWIVGAIVSVLPSNRAIAELIFEKGSGTTLKEVPPGGILVDDNATVPINLGPTYNLGSTFGGRFYGQPVSAIGNPTSTLYVSENGNLNFSENGVAGDGSFFPTSPTAPFVPRIAPLWDDVMLFEGFNSRIVNYSVPGQYLAIGWENALMQLNSLVAPLPPTSFQAVWFEADTVIRGYSFLKDDIVFGYEGAGAFKNRFGYLDSFVGITNGIDDSRNTSPLPGSINGYIVTDHGSSPANDADIANSALLSNLLAWEDRSFLLFRPKADPTQGYNSSKEFFPAAVPEPTTTVVMAFGLLGYTQWRRRRKPMPRRIPSSSSRSRRSQDR